MKKLESSLKNMVIVLFSVTVISVALLAFMNEVTKGPIKEAKAAILKEAITKVVPSFDNNPTESETTFNVGDNVYHIYSATKEGVLVGNAVEASAPGYGGDLKILVGFDAKGEISGYSVLEHAETPGLGSKAETWFQKGGKGNIIGRNPGAKEFAVNKDGGNIDAITASTITSRAFLKSVKIAYEGYLGTNNQDVTSGATASQNEGEE